MNKFKIALWLVFIAFLGLVVYQNQEYFLTEQRLDIDLLVEQYSTMPIPNIFLFAGSFIAGFMIAAFFNLVARFKAANTIKALTSELEALKSGASTAGETVATQAPLTAPREEGDSASPDAAAADHPASAGTVDEEKK